MGGLDLFGHLQPHSQARGSGRERVAIVNRIWGLFYTAHCYARCSYSPAAHGGLLPLMDWSVGGSAKVKSLVHRPPCTQ